MTDALDAQIVAARPDASSWVSANAGSGKTRVLTDRVARLLLKGTPPQTILCLTYTKAAAAEMQTRLFRTLGGWAMMPEPDLRAALAKLGEDGHALPAADLDRARTLFACALETPGGLKIQTIHAFCDALLRRFPLEAGVVPRFTVLEDRQSRALRAEVLDALAGRGAPEFSGLARHLGADDLDPFLQEINRRREAFAGPFDPARLAAALGADPARTQDAIRSGVLGPDTPARLHALAAALVAGSKNDVKAAGKLRAALAQGPDAVWTALEDVLLHGAAAEKNPPFTAKTGYVTNGTRAAHPALMAEIDALARRVEIARRQRIALDAFERSSALNAFARVWLAAWGARKAAVGGLDFDDLIDRARALLARSDTAAWVLWRLDDGLDHILIDEAQDTSPVQWSVIEAISAEFFAGLGARAVARTIFVVGDEKQSIYSFQGADPAEFGRIRESFDRMLTAMGSQLAACDLLHSFRSARPLLTLVDAVFGGPAGAAITHRTEHIPIDPEAPGRVELWPFEEKPEKSPESPWDEPLDMPQSEDPVEGLAVRIAAEIRGWLDANRALPGSDRAIGAGDVLILVQRRSAIFHAVIRALKAARVPVAGADVLRIGGELAVKDLLAALRVTATSADDLSLAALLRSPLGGLSETGLFELAHARPGTLWDALGATDQPLRDMLRDLRTQADYLRPFELLQRLLILHDGRRKLISRLGAEAEDGVDALLDQALAYETVEPPTLTGFLAWIDRDEVQVKRRIEDGASQVRVMTVHGAKGLEAPIVILPDTASRQESRNPPQILAVDDVALWRVPAAASPPALAAAEAERRTRAASENRRLLYVALTRARTWLIVAGAGLAGPDSWHAMTAEALASLAPVVEGGGRVLTHNWTHAAAAAAPTTEVDVTLPAWAQRSAPAPPTAQAPRAPASLGGAHALPGEGADEATARARGAALHLLLETLPHRPRAEWPASSARLLPEAPDRDALLAEAASVLDAPELGPLFAPDVLVEVDVTAPLGPIRLAGRIDRLIIAPDHVLAVDFKSNRVVPVRPDATPEAILRQMGAYAAALGAIYPRREIRTAVLWTRTATLMRLPGALTTAALARAGFLDPETGRP